MAKKHFVAYSNMTKKQKILNFLKILGFTFAGIAAVVGGVVLYIWATGKLIPGPVALTELSFVSTTEVDGNGNPKSTNEYVIDGNKEIAIDENNKQIKDENGNLVWVQKTDANGNPLFESIIVKPNEGCTELDAVLTIDFHSNPTSPILQVVEDENCSHIESDETTENVENDDKLYYTYNVKIGSPIYLKPLTEKFELNGAEIERNIGGWVKLTITQGLINGYCWVFVDDPILNFEIGLQNSENFVYDEENGYYNVYSNSDININQIFSPQNSLVLPSTNVPSAKGNTEFLKNKTITYQILPDQIATINSNGKISINPNREGETFSVQAYVISKYNNIGKEPNIEDYGNDPSQDPTIPYNRDYDKIRVFSNVITFKIKEIDVVDIKVKSPVAVPSFDVFEEGEILHNNIETQSTKINYVVDLTLTNEADTSYKQVLLSKVKMFVGYASNDVLDEKPVALTTDDFAVWDADINAYKKLVDATNYVTLEQTSNGSYHYVVNNYSIDNFYFVFYYELGEDEVTSILYDSVKFKLEQNPIAKIELISKQSGDTVSLVKLNYNNGVDYEIYSLVDNLNVNLTARDTTKSPTYSYVMFFTPVENAIVSTYAGETKAMIEGKECVLVAFENEGEYDFTKIVPIGTGSTKIYVAVVKTTTQYTGQDNIEFLLSPEGYVEIERQESFTLEITTSVNFTSINYDETNSKNIERAVTEIEAEDPEYGFAQDCQLFAEIYEEGKIEVLLSYDGDDDAVKNNRLQINLIYGTESIAKESINIQGENGIYSFTINALCDGYAKFQVLYDGEDVYKIGIKVLSIRLVGVAIEAENSDLNVTFSGEQGAVEYSWTELDMNIYYNSPKAEAKSFELKTYGLPELFENQTFLENFEGETDDERLQTLLNIYKGKAYTEVINNQALIDNEIETIQKLVAKLSLDDKVLKIYNTPEVDETLIDADVKVFDIETSETEFTNYKYKVNSLGKVLIMAQAGDIVSNPIIVQTKCPEIKVMQNDVEAESVERTIYAHGVLKAIDGTEIVANQDNIFGFGTDQLNFVTEVDGVEYNINNLIKFKFVEQTEEGENYTSSKSGATILNSVGVAIITTNNIKSAEIIENIVIFSDFGYQNENLIKYSIISDYKLNAMKDVTYDTPTKVNLFAGTNAEYPHIVVTNAEYDFENMTAKAPNKLYLPNGFDVSNLNAIFPEEFLASFNYADNEESEAYYHIYKVLKISADGNMGQNYISSNTGEVTLQYKTKQSINFALTTPGIQILSTSIKVEPGVTANFGNGYTINTENKPTGEDIVDQIKFTKKSGFDVNITDIDFSVTALTSDDLAFYYVNGNEKRIETFVEVLPENVVYITEAEYNNLEDKSNYKMFYVQTSDVTEIDNLKTYYEYVNGEYIEVLDPQVENLDNYFEKVYSEKAYYCEETYYQAIDPNELNINYMLKYYEAVYDSNNQIIDYQKTNDREIVQNKTYYYKLNYKQLEAGSNITNVFDKLAITLTLEKDLNNNVSTVKVGYDNTIKNITGSINFVLSIEAKIVNTENGAETNNYSGLYFKVTLI